MNDETRQMHERLFDHIILGLAFIALVAALSTLVISGFSSPWFLRWLALLVVALVAFGLKRVGPLVVAAYVLVLELIGMAAALLIQANTTGFIPYLFVPIIFIAGVMLNPLPTMALVLVCVLVIIVTIALTQQLSWAVVIALLPPVSLIILAALLVIEGKHYVENLGDRLLESRKMLRERTLEVMEAQSKIAELQSKADTLKQQLLTNQAETHQAHQSALQKSQGLYELIKGTIQELDTTVESLENMIDQLGEQPSSDEQAGLLEQLWQKIYHLNNLVINLEDIAQLKNERIVLNYQSVDIAHLIREIVGTARGLARGKNVEIRYQTPENLPKLHLDPVRIRQALLYVLNNAVKYTDQGIIEVQAELNAKELLIFVSDTGIGMHREEMELIFHEFGRGSGTLAKQRQGTGLGLAISKGLVELHGGHMWVTSVLGVGSTFYINLPLEVRNFPAAIPLMIAQPVITTPSVMEVPIMSTVPASAQEETLPAAKPDFGPPVGRYSPTYIGRFGFILLGLLLIIASAIAILAVIYGPVNEEIAATPITPVTAIADIPATNTATPTQNAVKTTASPAETPTSAPTTPSPTPTQVKEPSITPTESPTTAPTATPTDKPTSTPTLAPTNTPMPSSTPTSPASSQKVATNTTAQPVSTNHQAASGLSFVSGQNITLLHTGETTRVSLKDTGIIAPDTNISWSPDGRHVLFITTGNGNYEVYIANADGTEAKNLTQASGNDGQPSWSPDGRQITFTSERNGNVDIYIMDANGDNLRQLTTDRGYDEWPVWSPDGRRIAFVSDQDGNNEIYIINTDGTHLQRITNNPTDDWPASWSADGRTLVFGSNRDGNWNLYVVNVSGGEATRLTDDPADEREPAWSPDGRAIAFASNTGGNWDIYTLPAPGGKVNITPKNQWTQITNTPVINEHYPAWIP